MKLQKFNSELLQFYYHFNICLFSFSFYSSLLNFHLIGIRYRLQHGKVKNEHSRYFLSYKTSSKMQFFSRFNFRYPAKIKPETQFQSLKERFRRMKNSQRTIQQLRNVKLPIINLRFRSFWCTYKLNYKISNFLSKFGRRNAGQSFVDFESCFNEEEIRIFSYLSRYLGKDILINKF